jgi:hypothetical protein
MWDSLLLFQDNPFVPSHATRSSRSALRGSSSKEIVLLIVRFTAPYLTPKQDNAQMRVISEGTFCAVLQFLKGCATIEDNVWRFLWGVDERSAIPRKRGSTRQLMGAFPDRVERVARMKTIPKTPLAS